MRYASGRHPKDACHHEDRAAVSLCWLRLLAAKPQFAESRHGDEARGLARRRVDGRPANHVLPATRRDHGDIAAAPALAVIMRFPTFRIFARNRAWRLTFAYHTGPVATMAPARTRRLGRRACQPAYCRHSRRSLVHGTHG